VISRVNDFGAVNITNSGLITSANSGIEIIGGLTLNNQAGGIIQSDSDGVGDDGVAYHSSQFEDFELTGFLTFPTADPAVPFESSQGITLVDLGNGFSEFRLSDGSFLANSNFEQIQAVQVADVSILALVDIPATLMSGFLVFQADVNGPLFPPVIDVVSPTLGLLTVEFTSGSGFTVTDQAGNPVFDVPTDVDFVDTIVNDGDIFGDVFTGLADDVVTNSN